MVCFSRANTQEDYPVLNKIVTDNANLFSQVEIDDLDQKLTAYESKTTHQIVVLTINSLGNNTIENYAYKTFNLEGNRFGQKEADNGILILVAKNDREFRIEVGDGLTPIITDAFASRINRTNITPAFKEEDYFKGIDEATSEIIKLIDSPEYRDEFDNLIEEEGNVPLWGKILFGLFLVAFLGTFIFFGGRILIQGFKQLINLYKGLITGKISVLMFPLLLLLSLFTIAISLPFVIMPIFFAVAMITQMNDEEGLNRLFLLVENSGYLNITNAILLAIGICFIIPLAIAYSTRSKNRYVPIKFSLFKSDKSYMSKNFSSGGISSGSSSSFSSGSSGSSFSGGGGSSSGGGSSGSW